MFLYSLQPCVPSMRRVTVKGPASVRMKHAVYVCLLEALATTAALQKHLMSGNSMHCALIFCRIAVTQ